MTTYEALKELIATDASRTYFATKQARAHLHQGQHGFVNFYSVSMLPGLQENCTQFEADSMEQAVADAKHALCPPVISEPQPNQE